MFLAKDIGPRHSFSVLSPLFQKRVDGKWHIKPGFIMRKCNTLKMGFPSMPAAALLSIGASGYYSQ